MRVTCLFFFARKLDKTNMNTEKLEDLMIVMLSCLHWYGVMHKL